MQHRNHALYFIAAALLLVSLSSYSQKGINSIYSAYGVGDYTMRDPNAYTGMGNAGVALPSTQSINEINPASFGWIAKDRFILDIGFAGSTVNYSNENVNINAGDFSIARIALGMQVINPLRTVIGLRRFSTVDYFTTATRDIAGSMEKLQSQIEGNGGLYQLYLGNAITIRKKLSLGITTGFIFGGVDTKETMALSASDVLSVESNKYYNHGSINAGLQYRIGKGKSKWMFGAFYEPQIKLNVQETSQLKNGSDQVIETREPVNSRFSFPQKYGAGITWTHASFTATADVIGQLWSATGYKGNDFTTTNAMSYSIGLRHQFIRNTIWGLSEGAAIFAGYNIENSYLVIRNKQLTSNAVTLGVSMPSRNNLSNYSLGLKIGSRGQATFPMVKEKFFDFTLTMAFSNFFLKGKRYD